jgi:membrane fusion protein (multidrug efflux system)
MRNMILLVVAIIIVAGAGYFYLHSKGGSGNAAQQGGGMPPTAVDVYVVNEGDIDLTSELSGRTSAFRISEIRPQVSGIIKKRFFTEGGLVKKGEQLYQIDPSTYEAALESAKASLLQAEATVMSTKPRAERYAELVKVGGISQQEYDDAAAALKQAEASVAAAQAAVKTAYINLEYTKVLAPISGRIGKSSVTEGALVTANQATALATVQQLDKIYVDVQQSSLEARKLRKGVTSESAPVAVTLFVENEQEPYAYTGEFQFTDVSVDETTGMVNLRILFPNPEEELLPGLFVKAKVSEDVAKDVILVSQRSVMRNKDGSVVVWIANAENKVEVRPIETLKALGNKWIVKTGLKDGDRVLLNGFQKTGPGAVVAPTVVTAY